MLRRKGSFFEKLTGAINTNEHAEFFDDLDIDEEPEKETKLQNEDWVEEHEEDAELTVDMFQNHEDIIINAIVAGVDPSELHISITREMVTISGRRDRAEDAGDEDYFHKELYWGPFSRKILLPEEIDVDTSDASVKQGLLSLRLPKIDKRRETKLEVRSE